jgi:hypothetical protein
MHRSTRPLAAALASLLLFSCGDDDATDPVSEEDTGATDVDDVAEDPGVPDTDPDADDTGADLPTEDVGPSVEFSEGPYGTVFRDLAGPFSFETTDGPWSFEEAFTGYESYLFMFYTNDGLQPQNLRDFLESYWYPGGSAQGEVQEFINFAPDDAHLFFLSLDSDARSDVERMEAEVDAVIAGLDAASAAHWESHIHFVTDRAGEIDGWFGEFLRTTGRLWFGIDMFQRVRQLGMTTDILTDSTRLHLVAHEARYFSFERRRADELAEIEFASFTLFDEQSVRNERVTVELPSAEEMAGYDTLYVDLAAYCPEHLDENCHEWDRNSNLTICDVALVPENAFAEQSCQPRVSAIAEVLEHLGSCRVPVACATNGECEAETESCIGAVPGTDEVDPIDGTCLPLESDETCTPDEGCEEGEECLGYVAYVTPEDEILAETIACECQTPVGAAIESTHICNGEGTGLGDCRCGCPHQVAGWITTYHREGRWVTDITPMLATMQAGGEFTFNMDAGERLDLDLSLMFANTGVGERPREYQFLQGGGGFGENYNEGRRPMEFEVPDWTTRVEIVAFTTGHGFGRAAGNCAEFCNHTHHWEMNNRVEFLQQFPEADDSDACLEQVDVGTIPNQFGTWPFGRSGWCPGLDVAPWRADITDSLVEGTNTLRYQGLYRARPWEPEAAGGNIRMWSYLVFYGP